jgi:hypothetical protein
MPRSGYWTTFWGGCVQRFLTRGPFEKTTRPLPSDRRSGVIHLKLSRLPALRTRDLYRPALRATRHRSACVCAPASEIFGEDQEAAEVNRRKFGVGHRVLTNSFQLSPRRTGPESPRRRPHPGDWEDGTPRSTAARLARIGQRELAPPRPPSRSDRSVRFRSADHPRLGAPPAPPIPVLAPPTESPPFAPINGNQFPRF